MTTLSKIAIGAAAAIGITLAAVAYAHGPGAGYGQGMGMMGRTGGGPGAGMQGMHGGGPGAGMQGMHGGGFGAGMQGMPRGTGAQAPCAGAEKMGARLDAIESELKLTAEQTAAWEAFEAIVRAQMQTMMAAHPRWSQDESDHIAFMEQRLAGMKAVQKARTELYNVLTPEQQATVERYRMHGPRT